MRKIIIINLAALLIASTSFANQVTADLNSTGLSLYGAKTGVTIAPNTAGVTLLGKTSTGVTVGANSQSAAPTGYSMQTQHKQGTKAYGTSYDSTAIFVKDVTKGTVDNTGISNPDSTGLLTTGWTSM